MVRATCSVGERRACRLEFCRKVEKCSLENELFVGTEAHLGIFRFSFFSLSQGWIVEDTVETVFYIDMFGLKTVNSEVTELLILKLYT